MARLFTCGYEENNVLETMWDTIADGAPTIQTATVRSGTYAMRALQGAVAGQNYLRRNLSAAKTTGTLRKRIYFHIADLPDTLPQSIFIFGNQNGLATGSGIIHLRIAAGPILRIRNQLTAVDADGTTVLELNRWYMAVLEVVIADSPNGAIRLYLNGSLEASILTTDTLDGTAGINRFFIGCGAGNVGSTSANYDIFFDDQALNDETGSLENGLPQNAKIAFLEVVSDNSVTWERTGGAPDNAGSVNDGIPGTPVDTTYNSEAVTLNSVDRLNVGTLPSEIGAAARMILIDVYGRIGSTATTARNMRLKIWDDGGTLTNGPSANANVNGWKILVIGATNEHQVLTLAGKTKSQVESYDLGYENITDNVTRERRISTLWANVEWTQDKIPPLVFSDDTISNIRKPSEETFSFLPPRLPAAPVIRSPLPIYFIPDEPETRDAPGYTVFMSMRFPVTRPALSYSLSVEQESNISTSDNAAISNAPHSTPVVPGNISQWHKPQSKFTGLNN